MVFPYALVVGSFVAQTIVVFASNAGYFGGKTNVEVGDSYPTLFMPARWAFAIWGVIYALEVLAYGKMCFYSPGKMFMEAPSAPLQAAAMHLVVANACQLLWALAFTYERLVLSTLCMGVLAVALTDAALTLYLEAPERVLAVGMSLHAGWVCAALLLNVNLAAVQLHVGDAVTRQAVDLTLVFASLYAAAGLGAYVALKEGNPVVPLAIAWALAAIGAEKATSAVGAKYTRAAVKFTAYLLAGGLAALTLSVFLEPGPGL